MLDIRNRLADVRIPTLVVHCRHDACIPFELGRELAAGIPNARFVELDSRNHVLLENEPAWGRFCALLDEFIGRKPAEAPVEPTPDSQVLADLTERERKVLALVAAGLSNTEIGGKLFISEKTVRNHLTRIFDKLGVNSRARAIVLARNAGLH
jgi:DNA-binding CsgD family transcriptional regulator